MSHWHIDSVRCNRCSRTIDVLISLIPFYQSVTKADDAVGIVRDVIFVRHHDDGVSLIMKFLKKVHDIVRCFCIKVTGGFIGKNNRRIVY